ncbi:MAG: hypothetical protein AB2A00_30305 [Myxococcota bacterium]
MKTSLLLLAWLAPASLLAQEAAGAPAEQKATRAVVLPLRTPASASPDVVNAAAGVERAFTDALSRHAAFHVLSRQEIVGIVGKAAQDQLMGCDAESCVAEVADALGAELVVVSTMDASGGMWNMQASILDRRSAKSLRRGSIKARGLDNLLASLDQLARTLASGGRVAVDDPRLQERLGTDAAGMEALKQRLATTKDPDLTEVWTQVIIDQNAESEVHAVLQGLGILMAGLTVMAGMTVMTVLSTFTSSAEFYLFAPAATKLLEDKNVNPDGTYNYPVIFPLVPYLALIPMAVGVVGWLAFSLVVTLVDNADLGRIRVSKSGCCRDEERIRGAERPGLGRRLAPYIAAFGVVATLVSPLVGVLAAMPFSYVALAVINVVPRSAWGPTVAVSRETWDNVHLATTLTGVPLYVGGPLTLATIGVVASILLMLTEHRAVLSDDPPAARNPAPAAAPAQPAQPAAPASKP